jgi:Ca2+-binding RTX toxin-like protein
MPKPPVVTNGTVNNYTGTDIRSIYIEPNVSEIIKKAAESYKATKSFVGVQFARRPVSVAGGGTVSLPELNFVGYSNRALQIIDKAYGVVVNAIGTGQLNGTAFLQMLVDTDNTVVNGQRESIYSLKASGGKYGGITNGDYGHPPTDQHIETVVYEPKFDAGNDLWAITTLLANAFHEPMHRNYVHSQHFRKPGAIPGTSAAAVGSQITANLSKITGADVPADFAYGAVEALLRSVGTSIDPRMTPAFLDEYFRTGNQAMTPMYDSAATVYEADRKSWIRIRLAENWANRTALNLPPTTLRQLAQDGFLKFEELGSNLTPAQVEQQRDDPARYVLAKETRKAYERSTEKKDKIKKDGTIEYSVITASDDGTGELFKRSFQLALEDIREFFGEYSSEIGASIGSNLGRMLFDGRTQETVGSIVLGAIGREIGQTVEFALNGVSLPQAADKAFNQLIPDIRSSAVGAVSSYLTAELVEALGLEGTVGEFTNAVAGAAIGQIAQNLASPEQVVWSDGVNLSMLATAAASFFGSWLASELVQFDSITGQIGASIGSSVGAIVGAKMAVEGMKLGAAVAGPIGALVGAFVGYIAGGFIGSLIGGAPRSSADTAWLGDEFGVTRLTAKNGGSYEVAQSLAESVIGVLNGVIANTGSQVLDPSQVRTGSYGTYKKDYVYRATRGAGTGEITFRSRDAQTVVNHGAAIGVSDLLPRLVGGDIYTKRAIAASLAQAGGNPGQNYGGAAGQFDVSTLLGNIAIAHDYALYVERGPEITLVMAAEPESSFAAGWTITIARALELGLSNRWSSDWTGGWSAYLDERRDGRLNGVAFTPANLYVELESDTGARLFTFIDGDGAVIGMEGDTVDAALKDAVWGTTGADTITINGDTIANTTGLTINGVVSTGGSLQIRVAALVDGDAGDDVIVGGNLGNDLLGSAGNDTLVGGTLDDWLYGGAGSDRLFAGAAAWQFSDGDAAATANALAVSGGNGNLLDGGAGDDVLYGSSGSDWLYGGDGVDLLHGGAGGDIIEGGAGNDSGASGEARLFGGGGTDQYLFGYGDGVDVAFDEADNAAVPGATGDTIYKRIDDINRGFMPRNWAGGGAYEIDGSVRGGEDAVAFATGITFQDILLKRSGTQAAPGHDLIIELTAINPTTGLRTTTGDQLILKDWFEPTRRVEWLRFANGDDVRIADLTSFIAGSSGNDIIIGSHYDDFIVGGEGNDTIRGLLGDDFGFGGPGRDFVAGDEDNDWVSGGADNDEVIGGLGNDTVFGDGGNDDLYGSAGQDTLAGGRGDDYIAGGADNDVFRYSRGDGRDTLLDEYVNNWDLVWQSGSYTNGYVLDNATGTVSKAGTVVFDGWEWLGRFEYTDSTRTLRRHLGAVNGTISMNAGSDVLEFGVGIDIQDLLMRRVGNDLEMAVGTDDNEARAFDVIEDRITIKDWYTLGRPIETFVFVATGSHSLTSSWSLPGTGTDADDTITGTANIDWITGNGGNDTITGSGGNDILAGNAGADTLNGGNGVDTLYGGEGDDILIGGASGDVLVGGAGMDIASYTGSSTGMRAFLNAPDTNTQLGIGDTYYGIEGLEGTSGGDTLGGDDFGNLLRGAAGADTLYGGAGDDIYEIDTSHGVDTILDAPFVTTGGVEQFLTGNGGNDTLDFGANIGLTNLTFARQASGADLLITYSTGNSVTIRSQNNPDRAIEQIQFRDGLTVDLTRLRVLGEAATADSDLMVGDGNANTLDGLAGDDVISGGAGNDTLRGGDGDDVLDGGAGNDSLNGGNDSVTSGLLPSSTDDTRAYGDTIRYSRSNAGVTIDLAAGTATGGHATTDTIVMSAGVSTIENVVGSEGFGDTLRGDSRANRLFGLGGNDILDGRAGNDVLGGGLGDDNLQGGDGDDNLAGHDGNDTLSGGNGNDLLTGDAGVDSLNGDAGDDLVSGGSGDDTVRGGADNDIVGGDAGIDQVYGDAGNDELSGGDGNDSLFGGDGNDSLAGGAGDDQLRGEVGDDTYVFDVSSGNDLIVDAAGTNRIFIAGDILRDQVWVVRTGNDLRISIIGGTSVITVQGYYAASSPSLVKEIALDEFSLFAGPSEALIQAMTLSSPTTPSEMPSAVRDLLDTYWHAGGKAVPTLSDQDLTTNEDTVLSGAVGASDHDQNITAYTVATPALNGTVALNSATGTWTYTPSANFRGNDDFVVKVTDADAHQVTQTVTVTVASVNDAPSDITLSGAPASIAERDRPIVGTVLDPISLGLLAAVDVDSGDISGDFASHVFTTTDSRFEIINGNLLRLRAGVALDYETTPTVSIAVTATDRNGAGLSYTENIVFNVQNLDDYFYGTAGNDTLTGGAGRNIMTGLGGNDVINGGGANDSIDGGDGADQLFGNGGNDTVDGSLGDDTVEGGAGDDVVRGGDGVDTVRGGDGLDQLFGDIGNDTLQGGLHDDQLDGGAGNDRLEGDSGNDRLVGGTEDDTLIGGAGADRFLGGAGVDTVSYETAAAGVTLSLAAGTGSAGDAAGDIFEDTPERLLGSAFGDSLTGSAGNDFIDGGAGNDTIFGGAGNDTLNGGDGNDTINAESGNDTLNGGAGNDILNGGDDSDTYLMDASSGADQIFNFDPNGTDIDVVGYQGIANSYLWFEKVGNDLVVTAVGTITQTTIKDWYNVTTLDERADYKIDLFLAGSWTSKRIDAEALVNLMDDYTRPTTQAQYDALHANPTFENQWIQGWNPNKAPVVPVIATQTINEDGTLSLQVTITDDYTPNASVTVTAQAVSPSDYNVVDLTLVNAPTVGASDVNGTRTVTVTTKSNRSGQVAIKLIATDAGGKSSPPQVFLLNITPVADVPVVTQAVTTAPQSPATRPTLAINGWQGLDIQSALVDNDGSETLTIRISNVPSGLTFNAGTNEGSGVWRFTPAQLSGLRIQGSGTFSQNVQMSVTATATETANNQTSAPSTARALNIDFNAAPTAVNAPATLAVSENVSGAVTVGTFTRTDPDSGEAAGDAPTFSLTSNPGGVFSIVATGVNAGQLSKNSGVTFNFEAQGSYPITVQVTDSGGLSLGQNFTVNVTDVNESPTLNVNGYVLPTINENSTNSSLATIAAGDPDTQAPFKNFFYRLVGTQQNPVPAGVAINSSTGVISVNSGLDFETKSSYSFSVEVWDGGAANQGLSATAAVTLNVGNVNEATSVTTTSVTKTEFEGGPGAFVVNVQGSDPDGPLTYEVTNVTGDGQYFAFANGTNRLNTHAYFDFEAKSSYYVEFQTRDPQNNTANWALTVNIDNENEQPGATFTPKAYAYSPGNTWAGAVNGFDPDGGPVWYQIVGTSQALTTQNLGPYYMPYGEAQTQYLAPAASVDAYGNVWVTPLTNSHLGTFYYGDYESGGFSENWGPITIVVRIWDVWDIDGTGIPLYKDVTVTYDGNESQYRWSSAVIPPVVLDLDDDGVELVAPEDSTSAYDVAGDGRRVRTGWVHADDALLALDRNGDGTIAGTNEISFVGDLPGTTSDLEGLKAFDTDGSGSLDAGDARFGDFLVWQDADGDGVSQPGELKSLTDAGIVSIGLTRTPTRINPTGPGNLLTATAEFVRADGTYGVAGDVQFAYEDDTIRVADLDAGDASEASEEDASYDLQAAPGRYLPRRTPPVRTEGTPSFGDVDRRADGRAQVDRGDTTDFSERDDSEIRAPQLQSDGGIVPSEPAAPPDDDAGRRDRPRPEFAALDPEQWEYEGVRARGALHAQLDLVARRRLQMIDAMASFSAEGAAVLELQPRRHVDPRTLEFLTAVGGIKSVA